MPTWSDFSLGRNIMPIPRRKRTRAKAKPISSLPSNVTARPAMFPLPSLRNSPVSKIAPAKNRNRCKPDRDSEVNRSMAYDHDLIDEIFSNSQDLDQAKG